MPPEELQRLAAVAGECRYAVGELALIEDAEPATHMFVVHTGAVELIHADQVVEVLEPGECFGHPSVLSGLAPAFTVRALEGTTCLLFDREATGVIFGRPEGATYVARSMRERLVRSGHTVHGMPELSLTRVGAVAHGPTVVLAPDTTVREAAEAMTRAGVVAAIVDLPGGPGLVADIDLRTQVLAAGLGPETPVRVAVRSPVVQLPVERTAGEALVDLVDAHQREALVTDRGRVVGVVSAADIAGGQHSPFVLRRAIENAPDVDALVDVVSSGLPHLQAALLGAGLAPVDISRALVVQSDTVTGKLITLAFERHGPAPGPWAWMALGSVARRELTIASDQDNALAYADDATREDEAFYERVAIDINTGLGRCGFGEDNAGVLARDPRWRMTAGRWQAVLQECLERPDRSHLVRAAVSFDFRHVLGGLDVVPPLTAVLRRAREYPDFLGRLARTVTDWKVALGRRDRIATDKDGRFDIKIGGSLPIANLARLHALAAGITISATLDRLTAAEETGVLPAETADALREAFAIVARIRHEHHARCVRDGRRADNRIDPGELSAPRRAELIEALRAVAAAQRQLSIYRPAGL
jgi:CBS domain-containing protein